MLIVRNFVCHRMRIFSLTHMKLTLLLPFLYRFGLSFLLTQETCRPLSTPLSGDDLIRGSVKAMNVYYNYTGSTPCFDIGDSNVPNLGISGWDYQVNLKTLNLLKKSIEKFEKNEYKICMMYIYVAIIKNCRDENTN